MRAMVRTGTDTRSETAPADTARDEGSRQDPLRQDRPPEDGSRALVVLGAPGPRPAATGGRPLAGFLTQLIVGTDPALRPARLQRTRAAAALYARAADDGSTRRRA